MSRRNVLVAVNKELRGALASVADTALAEVARQLAREFDAGDRPASTQLTRVLVELRKMAGSSPPPAAHRAPTTPTTGAEEVPTGVADLAARAAARRAAAAG